MSEEARLGREVRNWTPPPRPGQGAMEGRVVRLLPGVAVEASTAVGATERGAFLINPPLEGF